MPHSNPEGKAKAIEWIREHVPTATSILDVGPGSGWWGWKLKEFGYSHIDAVEAWAPYVQQFRLRDFYRNIYVADVRYFAPEHTYELAILGDVLEHLTVNDAQKLVDAMCSGCKNLIVSVPWNYHQGIVEGNPFEAHAQPDLTPAIMVERYPKMSPIFLGQSMGVYVLGDSA